jgi:hypothetical protein
LVNYDYPDLRQLLAVVGLNITIKNDFDSIRKALIEEDNFKRNALFIMAARNQCLNEVLPFANQENLNAKDIFGKKLQDW